jgi:hypothetical protein
MINVHSVSLERQQMDFDHVEAGCADGTAVGSHVTYDLPRGSIGARDVIQATAARPATGGGIWLATFQAAVLGVGLQLLIEFDPAPNPDRPEFSTPIRLWNVLSYFTVWSNILVLVVAFLLWRTRCGEGRSLRCPAGPPW